MKARVQPIRLRKQSTRRLLALAITLVAITLAIALPARSLAATNSFDLQAAIDACPVGGTVTIPAGTFDVASTIRLKSDMSLQGAGWGQTILAMPAQAEPTNLLQIANVSNVAIRDLTLSSPAATGQVLALHLSVFSNVTVERVQVTGCEYALKADTQGSNLTVVDFTATACGQLYVSNLVNGLFQNLDLAMVTQKLTDVSYHAIYVCDNNRSLQFNNIRARGGSGWTVQLWTDYGWQRPSYDISFNGLDTAGLPMVIGDGYDGVTVSNLTAAASHSDEPCVRLYTAKNVTISGFSASGGSAFVGQGYQGSPQHVNLNTGTYPGNALVSDGGSWISDLVITGVNPGAGTPTTTAPTPPTTASTTTTTLAPTLAPTPTSTSTTASTSTTTEPIIIGTPVTSTSTTAAPTTSTTTPPSQTVSGSVVITNPAYGSTVASGTVTVRVSVTSSVRVGTVFFYVDGKQVGQDSRASYSFNWRTGNLAPGSAHTLEAVAYTSAGAVIGTASCTVTLAEATTSTYTTSTSVRATSHYRWWR